MRTRLGQNHAGPRGRSRCLEVELVDTGEGIAEKDLNSIFVPFYTTKERGTGLGLAICQRIVEGHGGTITVRSRKGRGSTFTMHLPLESRERGPRERGPEA